MADVQVRLIDPDESPMGRPPASKDKISKLVTALFLAVLGIVCILFPSNALLSMGSIVSTVLLIVGVCGIALYLALRSFMGMFARISLTSPLGLCIIALLLGLFPVVGAALITWVVALCIGLFGFYRLVGARFFEAFGSSVTWPLRIGACVDIVLAIVLCMYPPLLAQVIGVFALVHAASMVVQAFTSRDTRHFIS